MRFTERNLERLQAIVVDAAEAEILPRFRKIAPDGARTKSNYLDLVTDADEQAEWRMRDAIAKQFPNALFVGEESVARDKSLLDKIKGADLTIIIDPVDGTGNFAWGLPLFGVLAAVVENGETVGGLIYDPIGSEWLGAMRGHGAWATSGDGTLRDLAVAKPLPLAEMNGVCSWYLMDEPMRSQVVANMAKVKATFNYRCAAYEYRLVADGKCHFGLHWKLMPWDHAAGVLIHAEAGGYSACLDGSAYAPTKFSGGVMSAPDKASWLQLQDTLVGKQHLRTR
jgi:fructose-1,6-bisphosphatase/inositol monophosphatase family enzyme